MTTFPIARLTANISFLFPDLPFLDRIDAARAAGFVNVECHFPYDVPAPVLKERLARAGVRLTGINTSGGDIAGGEWGRGALPGREADFARDIDEALSYASALDVPLVHVMAGVVAPQERERALETYVANVRAAAAKAEGRGVTLVLEPLNDRDRPGYLVSRSDQIAEIIAEIGAPNVKIMFDVYHVQIMEGDLITRLARHLPLIGHVQIAAVPSRAEPDEGEVAYGAIFEALERIGYRGLVGVEYKPRADTLAGLRWMDALGIDRGAS